MLLDLLHQESFDARQMPKTVYEYKRYKEHLLQIQNLRAYEYKTQVDGQVRCSIYCGSADS